MSHHEMIVLVNKGEQHFDAGRALGAETVEQSAGLGRLQLIEHRLQFLRLALQLLHVQLQLRQPVGKLLFRRCVPQLREILLDFLQRIFLSLHLMYTFEPLDGFKAVQTIVRICPSCRLD